MRDRGNFVLETNHSQLYAGEIQLEEQTWPLAKRTITRFKARICDWWYGEFKVSYCLLTFLQGGNGYGSSMANGHGMDKNCSGS